jgi:Cupin superfamily protein
VPTGFDPLADGPVAGRDGREAPFLVKGRAREPLSAPWSFSALLDPVSAERFCDRYWGRRPLLIERAAPDFYRDVVSVAEMERYLSVGDLFAAKSVRLRPRDSGPPQPLASLGTVFEQVSRGKTLQLRKMESFMDPGAPLLSLAREMELTLQHPLGSLSCYLSPPGGEVLGPHHDETEIFTLQILGRKHWRLYHCVAADRPRQYSPEELGPPEHEFDVAPGDLLYHPRGHVHDVSSLDGASFSITIVIEPVDWTSVVDLLRDRLTSQPDLLEPLPAGVIMGGRVPGPFRERFAAKVERIRRELSALSAEELLDTLARRHVSRLTFPPGRAFESLFAVDRVAAETTLRLRVGLRCHLRHSADEIVLVLPGGLELPAPDRFEPALRFVLSGEAAFRVGDIAGDISVDERLSLARELIRHGVLTIESAGA